MAAKERGEGAGPNRLPEGVRSALEKSKDAQQLTDWLRQAALTASPVDFERFLSAAPSSGAG